MPKSIFETCIPRDDILAGTISDQELAADLAKVVKGTASADYGDATQFFANTYPTIGLRNLLTSVCRRVSGIGGEAAAIFRLDTSYGGGKTHGLIALVHAMRGRECKDLTSINEFVDVDLLPKNDVHVAAFTGENADPANGRPMGSGKDSIRAFTPWGEIAYELGGSAGYETVRESDLQRVAPGSETLQLLFNERAVLILLDELGVYLSKVSETRKGREQLIPFLSSLIQAVENSPNSALVYTLAIDQKGTSGDAYSKENEFIGHEMAELVSISGRKATLLNPTEINEYPHVLKRRFFASIDLKVVDDVVLDYQQQWHKHREELESRTSISETVTRFQDCYPFHPDVLDTLTDKTFTINNFQRIRGMLRLLGRTITQLWKDRPKDAQAIHLHHIDLAVEEIKSEFIVRMELKEFVPAIAADISGPKRNPALAERIDKNTHQDMLPYATYVARTIFMHTVAFNENLKGLSPERLRFSILSSKADISFIESARKSFIEESAFLDDRPNSPMRFVTEPNLTRLIQIEEHNVDPSFVGDLLNDEIRSTFKGASFETVMFPGGPHDVSDDIGSDKPRLVILTFDAISIEDAVERLPSKLKEIFEKRSSETQAPRKLRNHIVFLVAEKQSIDDMKRRARRRLALNQLKAPERIGTFADHQQAKIHELESKSVCNLTIAIQTCYRHMFYPSSERLPKENLYVAHAVIEYAKSANTPGSGQKQIVRTLKEMKKLREPNDEPDHPRRTRDLTPLKRGVMTTLAFRNEFRENPTLPMLIGDSVFHKGIKLGID
ncbi:MAG: DUF499 domain-containing protein [Gammaproteobacteria bacterium]|nr:DUF499 domain-containing protein [Gammaproteobacteria bacterium]MDE0251560.1 DUF499 domain-containing protein [Gammaproteobacteria bacterium]MDE0403430.1 DUF499 domain-containing protein [Gammaproteobacteria bacterium]